MKIMKYEAKYRDDLIFMVLEAKNALGRIPTLNDDLLDLDAYYFKATPHNYCRSNGCQIFRQIVQKFRRHTDVCQEVLVQYDGKDDSR